MRFVLVAVILGFGILVVTLARRRRKTTADSDTYPMW